ncbi:MAG: intradiol ring-cleavage dioxygenase [Actinomycetota bacterium]|nr:intradiol ring-cleavage dioxygenase [Actinomycetota bacterium]
MSKPIDRRQALTMFGTVGFGAVVAACGGDDKGGTATGNRDTGGTTSTTGADTTSTSADSAASAGTTAADLFETAGSCALTPEQAEGPYYLDIDRVRRDIREDRQGTPLRLAIRVREDSSCQPVADAAVDIWHCDATGLYSGFEAASTGVGGGGQPGGGASSTDTTRYLRGTQITNAQGIVEFLTVYPGWYRGRTVHIHCKVHLNNAEVLTTQLYFDEKVTSAVFASQPYASHSGRDTFNTDDGIFSEETILSLSKDGSGYIGVINLDVKSA